MGWVSQVTPVHLAPVEGLSSRGHRPTVGLGRSRIKQPHTPISIPVVPVPVEMPKTTGRDYTTLVGFGVAVAEVADFATTKLAAAGSAVSQGVQGVAEAIPSLKPNVTSVISPTVSPSVAPGLLERIGSAAGNVIPSVPSFSVLGTTWTVIKALTSWSGLAVTGSLAIAGVCLWRSCMRSSVQSSNTNTNQMNVHFNIPPATGPYCETRTVTKGKDVVVTHACTQPPLPPKRDEDLFKILQVRRIPQLRKNLLAAQEKNLDDDTKKQVAAILKELAEAEKERYQNTDVVDLARRVGRIDFMVDLQRARDVVGAWKPGKKLAQAAPGQ